jgi:serine/threonine-protein kinase
VAKVRLLDPKDGKRRLDRYELIGELASGGMATVFLARLGGVGGFQRFVAIKRLHPHLANEQDFIEMFLDEARLAAGIHHPHVVPILEVGESENGYYLVMEYVEGDTLARLMARSLARAAPIPRPVLMRIMLDTLAGLHAAHELVDALGSPVHLVHRDVSPQNILVGVDGCSRITDFGVAHASSRLQNTRTDRLKGKLAYMSPEQARAGDVDRRSDVFAMGVILWEVLAGKRLFKAENEAVTLQRVTVEPIPRLIAAAHGIHGAFDQICATALERDRNKRFATASDMAEGLERAARVAASESATDLGVASPREVAAYVQEALGEDIAAQRESVRAWLSHSEPSNPRAVAGRAPSSGKPPGYDVTMTMPLDRDVARVATGLGPPSPIVGIGARPSAAAGSARRALPKMFPDDDPSSDPMAFEPTAQAKRPSWPVTGDAMHPPKRPVFAGAAAEELAVESLVDDEEDIETALLRRQTATSVATALVTRKNVPQSAPVAPVVTPRPPVTSGGAPPPSSVASFRITAVVDPEPPSPPKLPSIVAPFSDEVSPSRSIDFYMVPPRPPPSRTPQLVAMGVGVACLLGAIIFFFLHMRSDVPAPQPLASTVATHAGPAPTQTPATAAPPPPTPAAPPTVAATTAPTPDAPTPTAPTTAPSTAAPPAAATPAATTVAATPVSALPPATPTPGEGGFAYKGKGRWKKGKSSSTASPGTQEPAAPSPAPAPEPKVPDDMPNPYRQ